MMSKATGGDVQKERYWRKVIREAAQSGLSIRRFCQQHRIRESQFHWWQRKLKERRQERSLRRHGGDIDKSGGRATFALVSEDDDGLAAGLELVLDHGRRLRIGKGVDEETLRSVLAALASPGC
jgi:transposase-like protein